MGISEASIEHNLKVIGVDIPDVDVPIADGRDANLAKDDGAIRLIG
jgi:hypothetical protein